MVGRICARLLRRACLWLLVGMSVGMLASRCAGQTEYASIAGEWKGTLDFMGSRMVTWRIADNGNTTAVMSGPDGDWKFSIAGVAPDFDGGFTFRGVAAGYEFRFDLKINGGVMTGSGVAVDMTGKEFPLKFSFSNPAAKGSPAAPAKGIPGGPLREAGSAYTSALRNSAAKRTAELITEQLTDLLNRRYKKPDIPLEIDFSVHEPVPTEPGQYRYVDTPVGPVPTLLIFGPPRPPVAPPDPSSVISPSLPSPFPDTGVSRRGGNGMVIVDPESPSPEDVLGPDPEPEPLIPHWPGLPDVITKFFHDLEEEWNRVTEWADTTFFGWKRAGDANKD